MDSFYWCNDCGKALEEPCKEHEVTHVKDRVIPTFARLTLPHVLNIKVVEFRAVGPHVHGVFAKKVIQKRTQFGPLLAPTSDNPNTMEQRLKLKFFRTPSDSKHIDLCDENKCNWLMFIRAARTIDEQNLVVFQHKGQIYFSSSQVIAPGKELKVWYAPDYAHLMKRRLLTNDMEENDYLTYSEDDAGSDGPDFDIPVPAVPERIPEQSFTSLEQSYTCLTCHHAYPSLTALQAHVCTNNQELVSPPDQVEEGPGNEDDSRSEDSPQKRNKRKGHPVKLSKSGRIIHPKRRSDAAPDEDIPDEPKRGTKRPRGRPRRTAKRAVKPEVSKALTVPPLEGNFADSLVIDQVPDEESGNAPKPKKSKLLYKCDVCSKFYPTPARLQTHQYIHTGEKPFACDQEGCGKAFTSRFKRDRHLLIHKPASKTHSCLYCDMTFHRKDHLKNHMKVHDPNKPVHRCDKCGREYATSFAFRTHMGFHLAEEGSLTCFVCSVDLEDKDKLLFHLKVHAGAQSVKGIMQRTQKCPHCDKRFFTPKDVRRHVIVHTGEKDYLCQYCPQRFGRRDHLTRHLRKAHMGSPNLLMTYADHPEKPEEVSDELPADLKSCKIEPTVPPMDYPPVTEIQDIVNSPPRTTPPSTTNSIEQKAQILFDTVQEVQRLVPPPQPAPIITAQISPNMQYLYFGSALSPTGQPSLTPVSSGALTQNPSQSISVQSLPISFAPNSNQPLLAKLLTKPVENIVGTLVPTATLNIQCGALGNKGLSQQELTVVQNLVNSSMNVRDPPPPNLTPAPLNTRDLTLQSPVQPTTVQPVDNHFFPPNTQIDPDKLNLRLPSPAPSAPELDVTDGALYIPTSQFEKLPELSSPDRRFFTIPSSQLDDIKLSDGPCIITEAQLASYAETLKALGNFGHIPAASVPVSNNPVSTTQNLPAGNSLSYSQALGEFAHNFQ